MGRKKKDDQPAGWSMSKGMSWVVVKGGTSTYFSTKRAAKKWQSEHGGDLKKI